VPVKNKEGGKMKKLFLLIALLTLLAGTGCSLTEVNSDGSSGSAGRYWDFDDVLVPSSMKLAKDKSMLFVAEGHKGGLLTFSDNLEINSLVNFFTVNMSKDGWLHKSSFKYPNVALFFAKPDKTCIIHIIESTFSTSVYIWVAPTASIN
jgi:hypothetical protein